MLIFQNRWSYLDHQSLVFSEQFCGQLYEKIRKIDDWVQLRSYQTLFFVENGCNCSYSYGRYCVQSRPMPAFMCELAGLVALRMGLSYRDAPNSVNVNKYQTGQNSVNYHSDDEEIFYHPKQGKRQEITIISLSLGSSRKFLVSMFLYYSCFIYIQLIWL